MREWQGRRDDLSSTAEQGLETAQNVSFKVAGEARRRPGLSGRIDESGVLVTEWSDPFSIGYLVFNSGSGTLRTVKISDASETTVSTGLSTANRGCFARSNGRLYFTNDFNAMQRIESGTQTAGTAGINAPTLAIGTPTTATGLCSSGTHGMRYRYFDSKSLYMSDPSPQTDLTLTGVGSTITFGIGTGGTDIIRSTDTKVDQVIIELTDAGSSTFYRAATVNQTLTGASISMSDTTLRLQVTASRDGDFNHQPPPLFHTILEHRGRLFGLGSSSVTITGVTISTSSTGAFTVTGSTMSSGWAGRLAQFGSEAKFYRISAMSGTGLGTISEAFTGTAGVITGVQVFSATPDMLYWSRAGFPESWNPVNFAKRVMQNTSDVPSGMISHHEVIYLCGQRTIRMLDYDKDPASGQLISIPTDMGLWNQRCVVDANGRIYAWGRSGVWTVNGLIPKHLSKPVDLHIDGSYSSSSDNYDVSKFEQFHGVYDPRERCIIFYYATSSEDYPQHAIVFDVDSLQWFISTWKQGIRCATMVTGGSTNPTRALQCDANGYSWYATPDRFDGVPASMSGGVVTVSITGSTTSVITVSESLPTSTGNDNLVGVIAVYSSQERRIASNTANTITLATALSAAPTIGTELYLGQINFAIRSKWTAIDGFENQKRPSYLMIVLVPGSSTGKLTLKFYVDHSTSPFVFTKGSADQDFDGVTTANGSSSVMIDLDGGDGAGVAFSNLPGIWNRSIAWEITSTRPKDLLRIVDVQWLFNDPRSSIREEGG